MTDKNQFPGAPISFGPKGGEAQELHMYNPETHFLQPKIAGYKQLDPDQVALINEGKELGLELQRYIDKLRLHGDSSRSPGRPVDNADLGRTLLDQRWISIGVTQMQQGLMAIIRGIAQPGGF